MFAPGTADELFPARCNDFKDNEVEDAAFSCRKGGGSLGWRFKSMLIQI